MAKTKSKHGISTKEKPKFHFFEDHRNELIEEHKKAENYAKRILYGMKNIDDVIHLEVNLDPNKDNDDDLEELANDDEYLDEEEDDEEEELDYYEEDKYRQTWN